MSFPILQLVKLCVVPALSAAQLCISPHCSACCVDLSGSGAGSIVVRSDPIRSMDMSKHPSKVDARTVAAHLLAVAATVLVLVWCVHFRGGLALHSQNNKQLIFNVHPVLMLLGPIVLAGEAILCYRSLPLSRAARKKAHLALHAAGLAAGGLGVYAVFKFHGEAGIPNLYSLHSWVGLATVALYALHWSAAFLAFFFPGASPATRRRAIPWHAVVGLLLFALAVATAQLGFLEKLTFMQAPPLRLPKYGAEALLVNFAALVVLLFGVAVVLATVTIDDATRYNTII